MLNWRKDGIINFGNPYKGVMESFTPFGINKKYNSFPDTVLVVANGAHLAGFATTVNWTGVTDGVELEFQVMTFDTGTARKLEVGFTTNNTVRHFINTDRNGSSYGSGFLQLEYGTGPTLLNFNTRQRYSRISNFDWHTVKIVSSISAGNERLFYDGELVASGPLPTTTGSGNSFFNLTGALTGPLLIRLKTMKIKIDGNLAAKDFYGDTPAQTIICASDPNYNMTYNNAQPFGQVVRFANYKKPSSYCIAFEGNQSIVIPSSLNPLGVSVVNTFSVDFKFLTSRISVSIPVTEFILDTRSTSITSSEGFLFEFPSSVNTFAFVIFNPSTSSFVQSSVNTGLLNGIRNVRVDYFGTSRGTNFNQNIDIFFDDVNVNSLFSIPSLPAFNAQIPVGRQVTIGNRNQSSPANFLKETFIESVRFYPNDPARVNSPSFFLDAKNINIANDLILDISGNNRHGNLLPAKTSNSPQQLVTFSPYSTGLQLNGTDMYAEVPDPFTSSGYNAMDTRRPMILRVVVRNPSTAITGTRVLVNRRMAGSPFTGFELRIVNGAISFVTGQSPATSDFLEVETVSTTFGNPDLYLDIEVKYDGSKDASGVTITVNGAQQSLNTIANTCTGNNNNLTSFNLFFFQRPGAALHYPGRVFLASARFGIINGGLDSCAPMFEYDFKNPMVLISGTSVRVPSSVQRNSQNINYLIPYLLFVNGPNYVLNIDKP